MIIIVFWGAPYYDYSILYPQTLFLILKAPTGVVPVVAVTILFLLLSY